MSFIVFEGLDGAGKSTLIKALATTLQEQQQAYVITREPGGTPLGEKIRELLLKKGDDAPTANAELFLYEAGRAQHVECLIRPALALKKWVLCDRYSASSVAFQCGGRGLSEVSVQQLNDWATQGLKPDLYVLLDLSTDAAFSRMQGRELDRFESEKKDFHERVRASYLQQSKTEPDRWLVLNADLSAPDLHKILLSELQKKGWLK